MNKHLKKNSCALSINYFSEKIKLTVLHLQEDALDMATFGEFLYKEQNLLKQANLDLFVFRFFKKESLAIGGGIWYEPKFHNNQRLCSYAFIKDENVILDSNNFSNDKYDYPNQTWYKTIKSYVLQNQRAVWTKPYYDDSGSRALMTTVGTAIYNENNKVVGITTVDWDLKSIIENLHTIQPTENSFVLFADEDDDFIISLTDKSVNENDFIGKSLKNIPWYSKNLKNAKRIKYNNRIYLSFKQHFIENNMIIIVNVPEDELYAQLKKYFKIRLFVLFIISVLITLMIFVILLKHVSMPINYLMKTAEKIGNGSLDEEIKIDNPEEFAKLANSFNKMTKNIKTQIMENDKIKLEKEKIEQELNIAKSIQHSVLPSKFPPYPNRRDFDVYASMRTSKLVGGDFYDFFFIDENNLLFLIADVSGKGVPAALFMMRAITLVKNYSKYNSTASEILTNVNKRLCESNSENLFVTMFLGILNTKTGEINCSNAGHNQPFIKKDVSIENITFSPDLVLGVESNIQYSNYNFQLSKNECLFLYTDGVTEAINESDEYFGNNRLINVLENVENNVETIINTVQEKVDEFANGYEQADDITMLALKYNDCENMIEQNDVKIKHLVLPAQLQNLNEVHDWISSIVNEENLSNDLLNKLTLVIEEVFVNVANYAYTDEIGNIDMYFKKYENIIELKFVDGGKYFNPLQKENPDINLSLEDRQIGGLGIFLVKQIMDSVKYEYVDNKNVLTAKIYI